MTTAYTKLGIDIEVGKNVIVGDGAKTAITQLVNTIKTELNSANLFGSLNTDISNISKALNGVQFTGLLRGLAQLTTALDKVKGDTKGLAAQVDALSSKSKIEVKVTANTEAATKALLDMDAKIKQMQSIKAIDISDNPKKAPMQSYAKELATYLNLQPPDNKATKLDLQNFINTHLQQTKAQVSNQLPLLLSQQKEMQLAWTPPAHTVSDPLVRVMSNLVEVLNKTYTKIVPQVDIPSTKALLTPSSVVHLPDGNMRVTQPYADPITVQDHRGVRAALKKAWSDGYAMPDAALENFGKVNGKVHIIDIDSLQKRSAQDANLNSNSNNPYTSLKDQLSSAMRGMGMDTTRAKELSQITTNVSKENEQLKQLVSKITELEQTNTEFASKLKRSGDGNKGYSKKVATSVADTLGLGNSEEEIKRVKVALDTLKFQKQTEQAVTDLKHATPVGDANAQVQAWQEALQKSKDKQVATAIKNGTATPLQTEIQKEIQAIKDQEKAVADTNRTLEKYKQLLATLSGAKLTFLTAKDNSEFINPKTLQSLNTTESQLRGLLSRKNIDTTGIEEAERLLSRFNKQLASVQSSNSEGRYAFNLTRGINKAQTDIKNLMDDIQKLEGRTGKTPETYTKLQGIDAANITNKKALTEVQDIIKVVRGEYTRLTQEFGRVQTNPFKAMFADLPVVGSNIDSVRAKLESLGMTQEKLASLGGPDRRALNGILSEYGATISKQDGSVQPVKTEDMIRIERAKQVIAELSVRMSSAKVSAADAAAAFASAGINLSQIKDPQALSAIISQLRGMKIEANGVANTFKDMSKHTSLWTQVFGESVGKMAVRLTEFYSIRSILLRISSAARNAVHGIIEFKQTVTEVGAITTASKEQMAAFESTISQLARSSKYSAQEIAATMKVVAQSGVQAEDIIPMTRASEFMAAAVGDDPKNAAHLMTTVINVWKMEASEALRVSNTMTAAMKNSKTTVSDLATAFNYLGTQAKESNMSVEETTAAVAVLRNMGVKSSTVGTGLSQLMKAFTAPSAKVRNLWKEMGITSEDLDLKKRELSEVVATITEKGVAKYGTAGNLNNKINAAFETRTGRAALAVLSAGSSTFSSMTETMKYSSANELALDRIMDGTQTRINKLQHEFQLVIKNLIDEFSPVIKMVYDGLIQVNKALQSTDFSTWLKVTGSVAAVAALGTAIGGVATAVKALGDAQAVAALTGFPKLIAGFLAMNPYVLAAVAAVTALGVAYWALGDALKPANTEFETYLRTSKQEAEKNQIAIHALNKYSASISNVANGKAKLTDLSEKQRIQLDKLNNAYPGLIDKIKQEGDVQKGLAAKIHDVNVERAKGLLLEAAMYNKTLDAKENAEANYASIQKERRSPTERKEEQYDAETQRLIAKEKTTAGRSHVSNTRAKFRSIATTEVGWDMADGFRNLIEAATDSYGALSAKWQGKQYSPMTLTGQLRQAGFAKEQAAANLSKLTVPATRLNAKGRATLPSGKVITGPEDLEEFMKSSYHKTTNDEDKSPDWTPAGGGSGTRVSPEKQQDELAKATIARLKEEIEGLKIKSKETPTTDEELSTRKNTSLSLLQKVIDWEKEKNTAEIREKFQTYDKNTHTYKMKPGVDSNITEDTVDKWIERDNQKLENQTTLLNKYYEDLRKERDKSLRHYTKEVTSAELIATEKMEEALAKSYEERLKHKVENASKALEIYSKEMKALEKKYNSKRDDVDQAGDTEWKDLLDKNPNWDVDTQLKHAEALQRKLSAKKKEIDAEQFASELKAMRALSNAGATSVNESEKNADKTLVKEQAGIKLKKGRAWTMDESYQLDAQDMQAQITAQNEKNASYTKYKNLQEGITTELKKQINLRNDWSPEQKEAALAAAEDLKKESLEQINEKYRAGVALLDELIERQKELNDTSFSGNFMQGTRESWKKFNDFKGDTEKLGSSVTDSLTNGFTNTLSSTFTTAFNPDRQKISEINGQIAELTTKKIQLTQEIAIASANSGKTPQEVADLNSKRLALSGVNQELDKQNNTLKKQKDAWQTFADGLKNIMKSILEELQKYIIKMIAVSLANAALDGATDLFSSLLGGGGGGGGGLTSSANWDLAATGGLIGTQGVKRYAEGGVATIDGTTGGTVPLLRGANPSKDSVPALLQPGEVIIKKAAVDYYGADKLLALNSQRLSKFAEGGLVGGGTFGADSSKAALPPMELHIINVADPSSIPQQPVNAAQVINAVSYDLSRKGVLHKQIIGLNK